MGTTCCRNQSIWLKPAFYKQQIVFDFFNSILLIFSFFDSKMSCHFWLSSIWILLLQLSSECYGDEQIWTPNSVNNDIPMKTQQNARIYSQYDSTAFPDEPLQIVRPDETHKNLVIVEENIKV